MNKELFVKYSYDMGHHVHVHGEYQSSSVYKPKVVLGWEIIVVTHSDTSEKLVYDLQKSLSLSYGKDVTIELVTGI